MAKKTEVQLDIEGKHEGDAKHDGKHLEDQPEAVPAPVMMISIPQPKFGQFCMEMRNHISALSQDASKVELVKKFQTTMEMLQA